MNNLIVVDTREKGHKKILEYFDKVGQDYIISKLETGDYMIYKNFATIIDKKDGLGEVAGNLCRASEHARVVREIERAKELGCKRFIFLIQDSKTKCLDDVYKWKSPYTKVRGVVLAKIMKTMQDKYGVEFMFTTKQEIGKKIIEILEEK